MKWYSKCHSKWCYLALAEYRCLQNVLNPTSAFGLLNKERLANTKRQVLKAYLKQEPYLLTQSGGLKADRWRITLNSVLMPGLYGIPQVTRGAHLTPQVHQASRMRLNEAQGWVSTKAGQLPTGRLLRGPDLHWALGNHTHSHPCQATVSTWAALSSAQGRKESDMREANFSSPSSPEKMIEGHSPVLHGERAGEPSALTYSRYRLGKNDLSVSRALSSKLHQLH